MVPPALASVAAFAGGVLLGLEVPRVARYLRILAWPRVEGRITGGRLDFAAVGASPDPDAAATGGPSAAPSEAAPSETALAAARETVRVAAIEAALEGRAVAPAVATAVERLPGAYGVTVSYAYHLGAGPALPGEASAGAFATRALAERVLAAYPLERRVVVGVDPADPTESVLEPRFTLRELRLLAVGAALAAGGLWTLCAPLLQGR